MLAVSLFNFCLLRNILSWMEIHQLILRGEIHENVQHFKRLSKTMFTAGLGGLVVESKCGYLKITQIHFMNCWRKFKCECKILKINSEGAHNQGLSIHTTSSPFQAGATVPLTEVRVPDGQPALFPDWRNNR